MSVGHRVLTRPGIRAALAASAAACVILGVGLQGGGAVASASGVTAVVTGTVERLIIDDFADPLPAGSDEITLVRTTDGAVQVPTSALASVANGATVEVGLADTDGTRLTASGGLTSALPAGRSRDPEAGANVATVRVVSTPAAGLVATGAGYAAKNVSIAAGAAKHQVLVVVAKPPGGVTTSTTPADVAALVSGGVTSYWQTVTGGVVGFAATAYPSVVSTTNAPCSNGGVSTSGAFWNEIESKVGWTFGSGKHLVVYFPAFPACGGIAGLGTIGNGTGSGGVIWSNGYNNVGVIGHELGHNLGLGHSQELDCTTGGVRVMDGAPSDCSARSYWDTNDIMAVSWNYQGYLNASHLRGLGLLGAASERSPIDNGQVTLTPIETGSGLRVLTLRDGGTKYVVEFRQAVGLDSWMASTRGWGSPGVTVRREFDLTQNGTSAFSPIESYLLDGNPGSADGSFGSTYTTMPVGTWIDLADGRLGIRIASTSSAGAVIEYRNGLATTDPRYVPPPRPSLSVPGGRLSLGTVRATSSGPVVPVRWSWLVTTPSADAVAPAAVTSQRAVSIARAGSGVWTAAAYRAIARATDGTVVSAVGRAQSRYTYEGITRVATYSRGWASAKAVGAVGGRVRLTTKRGAAVAVRVVGRSVGILLARGAGFGAVAVYLDGRRVALLNEHSRSSSVSLAWATTFPTSGSHLLRLVNLTGGSRGALGFDGTVAML